MSFIFAGPYCRSCCSSPLLSSIFRPEWISFSFLFCSFWHPTKLIASKGIGVEGLVLFWQFFQEWPSIRWSIVLERDLSLLNSWLAAKSRCYKGIESLQGTLLSDVKDEGQCLIMVSLPVYMSRWGDPIGRCLGFDRICIISIFSHDYSPRIMFWYSDPCKTKRAARIIWHFPVIGNKAKHQNKKWLELFLWLAFFIQIHNNYLFWLPDIEVFEYVCFMTDCWQMSNLFPCSNQMLIDLVECQHAT